MEDSRFLVINKLSELNISYRSLVHEPVFTVEESKKVLQEKLAIKNLLLKEEKGDQLFLVIMRGDVRLDVKGLAQQLDCKKLQFAKPDLLLETLEVTAGSVSLLCCLLPSAERVVLVLDSEIIKADELGFHPLVNNETLFIDKENIEKLLKSLDQKQIVINIT